MENTNNPYEQAMELQRKARERYDALPDEQRLKMTGEYLKVGQTMSVAPEAVGMTMEWQLAEVRKAYEEWMAKTNGLVRAAA